ncbi:hypothetical protein ID866_10202 [Astraeus odoratus]|nr:hypothetical protein ID866_10202 [Astraeus odoratus]
MTVRVWDAQRDVQISSPLEGHSNWVTSVAFSPDGTRIISGSYDMTVRVWDAEWGVQIGSPLEGHTQEVTSAAFSPDGTRTTSGSSNKTVEVLQFTAGLVKLHDDGWIRGHNNVLLLWIPPALQKPFYSMHTIMVIPRGGCPELDLSKMVHGKEWQNCFKETP